MSLFSLFSSQSLPPLSFTLSCSLSVCTLWGSQSTVLCHRSLSVFFSFCLSFIPALFIFVSYIWYMESNQTHNPYVRILYCFTLYLFIQLKQCESVLMQLHANCQKPSGGLSSTLEYSKERIWGSLHSSSPSSIMFPNLLITLKAFSLV